MKNLPGRLYVRFKRDSFSGQYDLVIYQTGPDGRSKKFAKPVKLEFEEEDYKPGMMVTPFLSIDPEVIDVTVEDLPDTEGQLVLKKSEEMKDQHIDNLNDIINKLLDRRQ